jgi:hypothetical protein
LRPDRLNLHSWNWSISHEEADRSTEPKWNAEAKDRLERFVCDMVCGGQLDIAAAQEAFAKDWIAAYHKYYETRAHRRQRALP